MLRKHLWQLEDVSHFLQTNLQTNPVLRKNILQHNELWEVSKSTVKWLLRKVQQKLPTHSLPSINDHQLKKSANPGKQRFEGKNEVEYFPFFERKEHYIKKTRDGRSRYCQYLKLP